MVHDFVNLTSKRRIDPATGFMHVDDCVLTKACVNEYWGREIPRWDELGLNPEKIYNVYRPAEEIKKSLEGINGLPILDEHVEEHDAKNPVPDKRIGAIGTKAAFEDPEAKNCLTFWNKPQIDEINSKKREKLSMGYDYEPVLEDGKFEGTPYQVKMTDIAWNHLALVEEGRVPGAKVADSQTIPAKGECMSKLDKKIAPNNDKARPRKGKAKTGDEEPTGKPDNEVAENRVIAGIKALAQEFDKIHEEAGIDPSITDEEKDALGKVRDFLDSFAGTPQKDESAGTSADPMDEEPTPAGDEEGNPEPEAEDEKFEDDPMKALTSKTADKKRPVKSMDAEAIKADIRREFRQKEQAILDVETLIGSTAKAMALDSAEEVYRHALKAHGIEPGKDVNLAGLKMAASVLKKNLSAPAYRAMDSKPTSEESKVMDAIDKSPYGKQLV